MTIKLPHKDDMTEWDVPEILSLKVGISMETLNVLGLSVKVNKDQYCINKWSSLLHLCDVKFGRTNCTYIAMFWEIKIRAQRKF